MDGLQPSVILIAGIAAIVGFFLMILFLLRLNRRRYGNKPDDRPLTKVRAVLTKDERVIGFAQQVYVLSPLHRDLAVVTNRRLIFFRPKLFGRMTFTAFLWQEVDDVEITIHMLSATLTVAGRKTQKGQSEPITENMRGLQKMPAQRLYALAQEIEEEWREKNRVRRMEEERAQSGGTVIHQPWPSGSNASETDTAASSVRARLTRLKQLYQDELISAAEYEARKAQIIADT